MTLAPDEMRVLGVIADGDGVTVKGIRYATGIKAGRSSRVLLRLEKMGLISYSDHLVLWKSLPPGDLLWAEACANSKINHGTKLQAFEFEARTGIKPTGKRSKIENAAIPNGAREDDNDPEGKAIRRLEGVIMLQEFAERTGLTDAEAMAAIRTMVVVRGKTEYPVAACPVCGNLALFYKRNTGRHKRETSCVACQKVRRK